MVWPDWWALPPPGPVCSNEPEPFCIALREVVQEAVLAVPLSSYRIAKMTGLSREMIGLLRRGRCQPGFTTLGVLCRLVLGCAVTQLVAEAERRCHARCPAAHGLTVAGARRPGRAAGKKRPE